MSAWLCTDTHISALVQQAVVMGVVEPGLEADNLWAKMKYDNLHALAVRYGDHEPEDWTNVIVNRSMVEAPLHKPTIWKNIGCWQYQCAEFDGWDQTEAHMTMRTLRELIEVDLLGKVIIDLDDGDSFDDENYQDLKRRADERAPSGHCWGIGRWENVTDIPKQPALAPDAHLDDVGD